jgi:hypothetical protein
MCNTSHRKYQRDTSYVPMTRLYLASREVICVWTVSIVKYVGGRPSMRAVGTRPQWPCKKCGKCTPAGMFVRINLSWKQPGSYLLGTLSIAQLLSHLSNIPAVGKPPELRDVTNPFFYSSVYYLSPLFFVEMSSVERLVHPLLVLFLRFAFNPYPANVENMVSS